MARNDQHDVLDLESPDTWSKKVEIHEPPRQRRSVVSVPFAPRAFAEVSHAAERSGEKLSVYIRTAALQRVTRDLEPDITGHSHPGGVTYYSQRGGIMLISGAGRAAIGREAVELQVP